MIAVSLLANNLGYETQADRSIKATTLRVTIQESHSIPLYLTHQSIHQTNLMYTNIHTS